MSLQECSLGVGEEKRPNPGVFSGRRRRQEPSLESPESSWQLGTALRTLLLLLLLLLPCGNFISTHSLVWRGERTQDGGARTIVFVSSPPPPSPTLPSFPTSTAAARRPGLTAALPTHRPAPAAWPRLPAHPTPPAPPLPAPRAASQARTRSPTPLPAPLRSAPPRRYRARPPPRSAPPRRRPARSPERRSVGKWGETGFCRLLASVTLLAPALRRRPCHGRPAGVRDGPAPAPAGCARAYRRRGRRAGASPFHTQPAPPPVLLIHLRGGLCLVFGSTAAALFR